MAPAHESCGTTRGPQQEKGQRSSVDRTGTVVFADAKHVGGPAAPAVRNPTRPPRTTTSLIRGIRGRAGCGNQSHEANPRAGSLTTDLDANLGSEDRWVTLDSLDGHRYLYDVLADRCYDPVSEDWKL